MTQRLGQTLLKGEIMKLIFKPSGILWIIDKSEDHQNVEGCTSVIVPKGFNPAKEQNETEEGVVTVYKTLDEVQAELENVNA
jgi:hypothetical protein